MVDEYRRQFLKTGIYLVGALMIKRPYAFAKTLSVRDKLHSYSKKDLLGRMIFGEATGCGEEEKAMIGWTPINRIGDGNDYTGKSLRKVLLYPKQYNCFDLTRNNRENLQRILYPEKHEPEEWEISLQIAESILKGELEQYNHGQTHFFLKKLVGKLKRGELGIDPKKLGPINSKKLRHQFYREI